MMNSINWTSFERAGFGSYKKAALSSEIGKNPRLDI